MPWSPLPPKLKFSFVTLFISYRSSGDKLIKYQANTSCVILPLILMTTLFYKALLLQGEIWCLSRLGFKRVKYSRNPILTLGIRQESPGSWDIYFARGRGKFIYVESYTFAQYPDLFHSYNIIYHYFPRDLPLFPRSACVPTQTTSCKTLRKCHIKRKTDGNQTKAKWTIENLM